MIRGSRWYILFEKNKTRIVYSDENIAKIRKLGKYKEGVIEYFIIQGEYMVIGYKIDGC